MLEKDTFMIGKVLQKTSAGSSDFEILDCPRRVNQKETEQLFFPYSPFFLRETLIPANVNTSDPERQGSEVVRQQQRLLELEINPGLAPGSGSLAPT